MKQRRWSAVLGFGFTAWRRRLLTDPGLIVMMFLASLALATVVSAMPRIVDKVSVDDLRDALVNAEPEERNLRFELESRIGSGNSVRPFDTVQRRGEFLRETEIPASVSALIQDQQFLVDTPRFAVSSFPDQVQGPFPTTFHFRYQEGIEEHLTVLEGSMPQARDPIQMLRGRHCPEDLLAVEGFEVVEFVDCLVEDVSIHEVALTATTASDMQVALGESVILTPDRNDLLWRDQTLEVLNNRIVLYVSAIIELSSPSDEFWYADSALHRTRVIENPDFRFVFAAGLMRPDRYRQLLNDVQRVDFQYTWRYLIDPLEITASGVPEIAVDLDKIAPRNVDVISQLPRIVDSHLAQRSLTIALLSTATGGLLVVGLITIAALSMLLVARHRRSIQLVVDRGASRVQVGFNAATTGAIVTIPAVLGGYAMSLLFFPDTNSRTPAALAALVLGAAAIAIAMPLAAKQPSASDRSSSAAAPSKLARGRRLVVEFLIFTAAIGAVLLLRRRGSIESGAAEGFDVLLSIAPAAMALAGAMIAVRMYTPLTRLFAWLGSRRAGVVSFVGFRRVLRQSLVSRLPTIVMLTAVAIATFSILVQTSVATGQTAHGWQRVGADYRIDSIIPASPLPAGVAEAVVGPGVQIAAGVSLEGTRVTTPNGTVLVDLIAIDAGAYQQILAGSTIDDRPSVANLVPDASISEPGEGSAPALVSRNWPGTASMELGDELTVDLTSSDPSFIVDAVLESFPGTDFARPFVVVSLDRLREATPGRGSEPTFLLLSGSPDQELVLRSALEPFVTNTQISSRRQVVIDAAGDPFAVWAERVLKIVFVGTVAFAAIAAAAAGAASAPGRAQDESVLRTIGMSRRDAQRMAFIELIPPVLIATVVGLLTGFSAAELLQPRLNLGSFAGGERPVDVTLDLVALGATGVVLLIAMAAGLAVVNLTSNRQQGVRISRAGDL